MTNPVQDYKTWSQFATLPHVLRRFSMNYLQNKLITFGGLDNNINTVKAVKTVYNIDENGSVTKGTDLPSERYQHCSVVLDSEIILIAGGYDDNDTALSTTWIFNVTNESYIPGPDMFIKRVKFGCSVFYSPAHDLRPVVIVVGGMGEEYGYLEQNFIWDYTKSNTTWESSK
jgi:hypothetical protein